VEIILGLPKPIGHDENDGDVVLRLREIIIITFPIKFPVIITTSRKYATYWLVFFFS